MKEGTTKAQEAWERYQVLRQTVADTQARTRTRSDEARALTDRLREMAVLETDDRRLLERCRKQMLEVSRTLPGLMHSEIAGQLSAGHELPELAPESAS